MDISARMVRIIETTIDCRSNEKYAGGFDIVCCGRRNPKGGARKTRCRTYQHFGEAPLELDGVRHRLSRRATHAAAARVRSAQAAHAHAGLIRVMRHAGLDTADENLTYTAIALPAATLHDAHDSFFARARRQVSRTEIFGDSGDSRRC